MRLGPALLGAAVLLAAALAGAWALGDRGPTVAGANGVQPGVYVADVRPQERICARGETLPERAEDIVATIGTYRRGNARVAAEVLQDGRVIARGGTTAPEGVVRIPVRPVPHYAVPGVSICLVNRSGGRIAVAGVPTELPNPAVLNDGRPARARLSFSFGRERGQSWLDLATPIARRAGLANASLAGSGTLWALAGVVIAAILLAGAAVVLRRRPE